MGIKDVDIRAVQELIDYDPETGHFHWRERDKKWFSKGKRPRETMARIFNTTFAGKRAFTAKDWNGYLRGNIAGQGLYAHQLAWLHFYGTLPEGEIDHIDRDKTNNRISNLRDVRPIENRRNSPMLKNNKSGFNGVAWVERDQRWYARIWVKNKLIHLGYFKTKSEAIAARKAANKKHNFHESHGL